MKAAVIENLNTPIVLKEMPKPELAPDEVLVAIKAAALNHRDVWIQKGQYPGVKFPIILGSDGAGVVADKGREIKENLPEEVIINPNIGWGDDERVQAKDYKIIGLPNDGTFAEFIKVKADRLHAKPAHLSFEQAAAIPLAGLTAYRALFTRAQLQPEDKVLITGAGGGVAQFVLQFAVAAGAEVYVTSGSDEKIEQAMKQGAKGGANYKNENWADELKKQARAFDVIIDSAAGGSFANLVELAAPAGRIAIYGGTLGKIKDVVPGRIFWKQLNIMGSTMGSDQDFADMLSFINEHKLVPMVDSVYPLKDAEQAFRKMDAGKQTGKIVLQVE